MHRVLLTCPPMIGMVEEFSADFVAADFDVTIPEFTQKMSEDALCEIIGEYDGWIIGDDPASRRVLEAGIEGNLRACMRWGVGTDNVDFEAFKEFGIPVQNTPNVFGREVADLACHYVTALARKTFEIDRSVKKGDWFKPVGQSLWSSRALIVGFGDIGRNLSQRLLAHDMEVWFTDPSVTQTQVGSGVKKVTWPDALSAVDHVIFTTPLNTQSHHMLNHATLKYVKPGMKVINVGRGPLIDEKALLDGLQSGQIEAAALDVFEVEPVNVETHADLLEFSDQLILGSHNGSNTREAVSNVSRICISKLHDFLTKAEA